MRGNLVYCPENTPVPIGKLLRFVERSRIPPPRAIDFREGRKNTSGVPKKDTYSPGVERGTTFVYYIILERIFIERDFNRTFKTGDESLT